MSIKEKIKEIECAVDTLIGTDDNDGSFEQLKEEVKEKIRETREAADVFVGTNRDDHSVDIHRKIAEIESATDGLLDLDDDEARKEKGNEIRRLVKEIQEASDVILDSKRR